MTRSNVAKDLFLTDLTDGWKRKITGGFWNTDPSYPYKPHAGIDYGADIGEVLIAYDDFKVIGVNTGHSDYGLHVFLYFPKIDKTGLYGHLSKIDVKLGQVGKRHDRIGLSGNTGKSGGPHLHFGLAKGKVTDTVKGNNEGDIWVNFETYVYDNSSDIQLKVGDILEVSTMYENHHLQSTKSITQLNDNGRGVVYVTKVFPEDNNPLEVSYTKGGAPVGGVRPVNVYRANQEDILNGVHEVEVPVEKPKPIVTNIGKYANMSGNTWLFKVARTDETYPSGYNVKTDIRNRSAKILADDNGRVKVSVPSFDPNIVWVAKSQVSITDSPKYEVS